MTLAQLAHRLGTHPGTVRRWVVRGLHGVKLDARCVGDRWCVAWDDYLGWQRRVDAAKQSGPATNGGPDVRVEAALAEIRRLRMRRPARV
jgi:hypothetical protein